MAAKCLLDYANTILRTKTAKEVYERLSAFAKRVYNTKNCSAIVRKNLLELDVAQNDRDSMLNVYVNNLETAKQLRLLAD